MEYPGKVGERMFVIIDYQALQKLLKAQLATHGGRCDSNHNTA